LLDHKIDIFGFKSDSKIEARYTFRIVILGRGSTRKLYLKIIKKKKINLTTKCIVKPFDSLRANEVDKKEN